MPDDKKRVIAWPAGTPVPAYRIATYACERVEDQDGLCKQGKWQLAAAKSLQFG